MSDYKVSGHQILLNNLLLVDVFRIVQAKESTQGHILTSFFNAMFTLLNAPKIISNPKYP